MTSKTACVIGANRGIGLGFVEQLLEQGYQVIATCRHPAKAKALNKLMNKSVLLEIYPLEVTDDKALEAFAKQLDGRAIDRLIINAGTAGKIGVRHGNPIKRNNLQQVFNVNAISAIKIADRLIDLVSASNEKLLIAISSIMGSISDNTSGGSYAYRASKTALNAMIYSFALDVRGEGIHTLLFYPGWVKTDMGGPNALIDVATSVSGMLNMMENAREYATGSFLDYAGAKMDW
ncbi:MAG: SDR family oxidoreductase [Pseudomonadota bacterium]